jgi:hypothetical protein
MAGDGGLVALRMVVEQIRAGHRACRHGMTVCNLGGCPWPNMHEEDVTVLHGALTEAGFEIRPATRGGCGETG